MIFFLLFLFLFNNPVFTSTQADIVDKIDQIILILGTNPNKTLYNFLCDEDNWKSLKKENVLFNSLKTLSNSHFGHRSDNEFNGTYENYLNAYNSYLNEINSSSNFDNGLENLVWLLRATKIIQNYKSSLDSSVPDKNKNFINSMDLTAQFNYFFNLFISEVKKGGFDDHDFESKLKNAIAPTSNPSSTVQTPPTGWSTTKKALVFGGSGIGVLALIGLVLFFTLGKSRIATSAT